ncbi:hypothetical protein GKZ68_19970 [Hymenobacter sp. BRD128]|uniref:hypothetical protein n=1 Tax=Hymenobacter sp. BRD128 TaxID=2675878 RepID=UPI001565AF33|nr:hypothetical protein [Hymenobacter sp. BRD128]QKG58708.1 hypothetical protein GKZ68_19970 [Hymenobacter sp. BRD128]
MLHTLFEVGFEWLARRTAHRHWRWWLAGLCLLVAATFQFPKVNHAYAQLFAHTEVLDEKLRRINEQIAAPFTPRADVAATHLAKMSFRLAVPLLARVLHLPLAALLGLQVLAGLAVFYRVASLLAASLRDRVAAALLTLGLALTYFGYEYTYDLSGYFDGLGYAALILALGARRWLAIWGLVLAGGFVDERVLAASTLLVFWYGARQHEWQVPGLRRFLFTRPATAVYAAWLAYGALRLALMWHYGLHTAGGLVGMSALFHSSWHELLALGFVTGLSSYWLPVALALALLAYQRRWQLLMLLLGSFAPIFAGAFAVTDITRSLAFGMPVALISLDLLGRHTTLAERRYLALVVVFFALLIPAYFTTGYLQYAGPVWLVLLRVLANRSYQ